MAVSKKGKILLAAGAAVMLTAAVLLASGSGRRKAEPRIPVDLNASLTNEMSDTSILKGMDSMVTDYMRVWGLKGVSLSVMRNDS